MGRRSSARWLGTAILVVPLALIAPASGAAQADDPGRGDLELVPGAVTPSGRVNADKAPTSRLAESDRKLLRRTDAKPVRVMIKLDYDSTATYQGGVDGLSATSPSATGRQLTGKSTSERRYEAYVAGKERSIRADITAAVPEITFGRSLVRVYGGVSAVLPANQAKDVAKVPGVVAVQRNAMEQPLTDSSADFVNADAAYAKLQTTKNAGKGVIYGNLDTGIWPEHPSFADQGNLAAPPGPARECNYGDNPLTPASDPFVCQNKLIGGVWETQDYDADPTATPDPYAGTARDGDGHGTHTSSTSAGNIVQHADVLGVDRGPIHGMAPGSWVIEYKVCGPDGCYGSDSTAAVAQAIVDGVDVINFSISGGTVPFSDPVELAFLDAYAAGVFVSASAGNDGPGAGTVNHLSPWTTSVAASTQAREFASTLSLTAGNGDTFTADGASITDGAGPAPVVLAGDVPGYGDALCATEPSSPTLFDGLIVACQRGGQARVWKGFVAFSGGAEGMVLYNPTQADTETDNHWLPTVHLADGTDFVAFMESHTGVTGSFTAGEPRNGQGDVMAAFSSRGPGGLTIKPDITAPGVQILAGASPTPPSPDPASGGSPPGELYQAIAGTSMSSPHVAGAALLARAVNPAWTPGQIRSALMTTAITDVVKEDTTTPADPFDMGAGRIDVGRAIAAPVVIDETMANFVALGNDPVNAVHLNIPSINAPVMPGRLVTTRTVKNVSKQSQVLRASATAGPGTTITVSPQSKLVAAPGRSVTFTITIESVAPVGTQQFGTVRIKTGNRNLHLPVAFIHTQGDVDLTQACNPTTVAIKAGVRQTECTVQATNNSFDEQVVTLDSTTPANMRVVSGSVSGATQVGPGEVHAEATLAGAAPGVPSVGPPGFGYFGLEQLGVPATPIGDEEIINYNISPFEYAGQTWDAIGVDSNGYLIVGGGSSQDNECCTLPAGPDPARPNNILAPFWTDLDGTGAPGVFVAVLTGGGLSWLVVEYQLNVFGTTDLRTFQVWIGINGVEDIAYEYATNQADPNGLDFLVGAENIIGQGEMESALPTSAGLVVTSTDPTPGDILSYSFRARGTSEGSGDMVTEMRASRVPGVTVARTPLKVVGKLP